MLTKVDLKEIRKIIREEVETEAENTKSELQSEMKMNMIRIVGELKDISSRMKNMEIKVNKIQKDLKYSVNFLDKFGLNTQKRIEGIEKHLRLEPVSP
ncbi:hypothetical protein A2955_05240 [Candidatus Woesebacteria bacterium RIFCSPLOWO2_01_FULL_37_19]|uniref:Uncharacterized protein n=2 Tax=Candidatus Woeseibacteriota TaxID=1752722 RepID=A0A1F8AZD2_9BACT|nr:MAG: hypothetical protein A2771_01370 [Candidatus Woesebacteria bacterium RIFCSPHIGHO2_01_FULL_38_26b]OGM56990.1 MAG: hypothetical protein A2955_05240 [Candidatus Woesebacteria bacterium RIFCSPLOWO2_01_FULL_37_19]